MTKQSLPIQDPKVLARLGKTGRPFPTFWRFGWAAGVRNGEHRIDDYSRNRVEYWRHLFWNVWWLVDSAKKTIIQSNNIVGGDLVAGDSYKN